MVRSLAGLKWGESSVREDTLTEYGQHRLKNCPFNVPLIMIGHIYRMRALMIILLTGIAFASSTAGTVYLFGYGFGGIFVGYTFGGKVGLLAGALIVSKLRESRFWPLKLYPKI